MLFNSHYFIFIFLPIAFLGFYILKDKHDEKYLWIALCSLFFYGYWKLSYLPILLLSLIINYFCYLAIRRNISHATMVGIVFNLALLFFYKYFNFFINQVEYLTLADFNIPYIELPIGISFFTFQQIAFLVDARIKRATVYSPIHYVFFITFFPQLIAGPIVHYSKVMPQLSKCFSTIPLSRHIFVGISLFSLGLFKKAIIADNLALISSPVFEMADQGKTLHFADAWFGALAYSLQLYFDFSGYSDMALGLGRFFGIRLPVNFNSPYKSINFIDFWRRWHITLSHFLKDYIYIPLGGNRHGRFKQLYNIFITMALGGIWHGASWNFLFWGMLHGSFLIINHIFINVIMYQKFSAIIPSFVKTAVVFLIVSLLWVLFRAESFDGAMQIYQALFGLNKIHIPSSLGQLMVLVPVDLIVFGNVFQAPIHPVSAIIWLTLGLLLCFFTPNSQKITAVFLKNTNKYKTFIALYLAALFVIATLSIGGKSEFLYFQF